MSLRNEAAVSNPPSFGSRQGSTYALPRLMVLRLCLQAHRSERRSRPSKHRAPSPRASFETVGLGFGKALARTAAEPGIRHLCETPTNLSAARQLTSGETRATQGQVEAIDGVVAPLDIEAVEVLRVLKVRSMQPSRMISSNVICVD
jgi:hypothetical protein